jgi:hypothetical protein
LVLSHGVSPYLSSSQPKPVFLNHTHKRLVNLCNLHTLANVAKVLQNKPNFQRGGK